MCDMIITTFLLFLSLLVLSPSSRRFCFDPPLIVRHPKPSVDKPDKLAPAPSSHRPDRWGPAASEDKARAWAETVMDIVKAAATPYSASNEGTQELQEKVSGEVNGVMVRDVNKRGGEGIEDAKEKSKKALAMDLYGQPAMRVIGGLADKWERVAK
jgi:hypothetical protein